MFCNKSVSLSVLATEFGSGKKITEAQVKISVKKNKGGSVAPGFTEISDLWRNTTEAWQELVIKSLRVPGGRQRGEPNCPWTDGGRAAVKSLINCSRPASRGGARTRRVRQ